MTTQLGLNRFDQVTHLQLVRILVIFLGLIAFGLCGVNGSVPVAVVQTIAFVTTAGFAVLDGTEALPESLSDRSYTWALIVPISIAVNVIVGTILVAFGPALTSCWFWGFNTVVVGLAIGGGAINRRRA